MRYTLEELCFRAPFVSFLGRTLFFFSAVETNFSSRRVQASRLVWTRRALHIKSSRRAISALEFLDEPGHAMSKCAPYAPKYAKPVCDKSMAKDLVGSPFHACASLLVACCANHHFHANGGRDFAFVLSMCCRRSVLLCADWNVHLSRL